MEIEVGEFVTLVLAETRVSARLRGYRNTEDGELEVLWLGGISEGFYIFEGWKVEANG